MFCSGTCTFVAGSDYQQQHKPTRAYPAPAFRPRSIIRLSLAQGNSVRNQWSGCPHRSHMNKALDLILTSDQVMKNGRHGNFHRAGRQVLSLWLVSLAMEDVRPTNDSKRKNKHPRATVKRASSPRRGGIRWSRARTAIGDLYFMCGDRSCRQSGESGPLHWL